MNRKYLVNLNTGETHTVEAYRIGGQDGQFVIFYQKAEGECDILDGDDFIVAQFQSYNVNSVILVGEDDE